MAEQQFQEFNVHTLNKGMVTDVSPLLQPKGTYRYALNSVLETEEGDVGFISNEQSNEEYLNITEGFILIGKCYMVDNETCLFSVNPTTGVSEIGVMNDRGEYKVYVNDESTPVGDQRLNFSQAHQIQATYRLRRGCEKTIYWVDSINNPRYVNLSSIHNFKDSNGNFSASKFKIFKTLDIIPQVDHNKLAVLEGYGNLKPGSYTILMQYLDQDLNPTKFTELVNNIIIYNDSFNRPYGEIGGSIYIESDEEKWESLQFENTNKGIQIDLVHSSKNFNFSFIRYAIVEYTSGTGQPSRVVLSDYIDIENSNFIYTGDNGSQHGTIEEIQLFGESVDIDIAKHIEQIDNRLLLTNTSGKRLNVQNLQKYASRIKTDCKVRPVNLSTLGAKNKNLNNRQNPKNPFINSSGVGYMPGEVYAFGIVYIFKDGTSSPVFHIPGKAPGEDLNKVIYSPGQGIYPMSNRDNISTSIRYTKTPNCSNIDFWGKDCEGNNLGGTQVRFHRFPTRQELGLDLITRPTKNREDNKQTNYFLALEVVGIPKPSVNCEEGDADCTPYAAVSFLIELSYKVNGLSKIISLEINPDDADYETIAFSQVLIESDEITDIELKYYDQSNPDGTILSTSVINEQQFKQVIKDTYGEEFSNSNIDYSADDKINITEPINEIKFAYYNSVDTVTTESDNTYSNIFGVKFSDIEIPDKEEIGEDIIGYQIVRLNREDEDTTVIDTGVLFPMSKYDKKKAFGGFTPHVKKDTHHSYPFHESNYIDRSTFNVISLRHKFQNKSPDATTHIREAGRYTIEGYSLQASLYQDVLSGSSAEGIKTTSGTKDDDGWSLKVFYRFRKAKYINKVENPVNFNLIDGSNKDHRFYLLNAVEYAPDLEEVKEVINPATDETALILSMKGNEAHLWGKDEALPYVYFCRDHKSFYSNFRSRPYQLCDTTLFKDNVCEVFGGDTYLSPLRQSAMFYMNTYQAKRVKHQSWWKRWGQALLGFIGGLALAPFTGGSSLLIAASISFVLAGIVLGVASVIEANKFREVYDKKWKEGLAKVVRDLDCQWMFVDPDQPTKWETQLYYEDDTIGWFTDSIGDIWLESSYNANLRIEPKGFQTFLKPQTKFPEHDHNSIITATRIIKKKVGQTRAFKWKAERAYLYKDEALDASKKEIDIYTRKITKPKEKPTKKSDTDYTGVPVPTMYFLNPDYNYIKRLKYFYSLPISYDYCSECIERFPHRVYYSEQSFQEEKTDNYTKFLPNNYRDIEGETGEITNIFKMYNNLYIHTEEALWLLPRNYQERVTDQIVSFIGTGSFFEIPPQKLIDDDTGKSAGTVHKWSSLKTPYGYFFVSENQGKIYQFDGKIPKPISDLGMNNWFERNIKVNQDFDYKKINNQSYPFRDNPSSIGGSGFISTIDTINNRIIFTKKDKSIDFSKYGTDIDITYNPEGQIVVFRNISQIIANKVLDKWFYLGIIGGRMKFYKEVTKTRKEKRKVKKSIFKDVDYILFRYNFQPANGRDLDTRTKIIEPFTSMEYGWSRTTGEQGLNASKYIKWGGDNTGYGREMILINLKEFKKDYPDAKNLKFECKAFWYGERNDGNMNMNAEAYKGGVPVHIGTNRRFESIAAPITSNLEPLSKPITPIDTKPIELSSNPLPSSYYEFRIEGGTLQGSYDFPTENITVKEKKNIDGQLVGTFNYNIEKGELLWEGRASGGNIPPAEIEVEEEVEVEYIDYEYSYVDGELVQDDNIKDYSWTMSFSPITSSWISYHSYKPNMYIDLPNRFFSWENDSETIWEHNSKNKYQTYYNKYYPHILEFITINNPVTTSLTNFFMFQSEAKTYDEDLRSFVDDKFTTFNKAVMYNTRQCSGEMELIVKDSDLLNEDYMGSQVLNTNTNHSIIDRTERDWYINDFRDLRIDYSKPIWKNTYSEDLKVLNESTIDVNKDWTQQESFRDKFLGVRLIFDKFANRKLITNFILRNDQVSWH